MIGSQKYSVLKNVSNFLISIDNTPISIQSLDPKNNSNVKGGESLNITFGENPYSITYSWNNGERSENLSTIPTEEGVKHILSIKAYDKAGNLLEGNLIYYIPTEIETKVPFMIFGGFSLLTVSAIVIIKKELIFSFLKKYIKSPKQVE